MTEKSVQHVENSTQIRDQNAAREMEVWFPEYAFDAEAAASIDDIPQVTIERLQEHFGEGDVQVQLRQISDSLFKLSGEDIQATIAMYICGYPKETINRIALVELDEALVKLSEVLPKVADVSQKLAEKVLQTTVIADTNDDAEIDDTDTVEGGVVRTQKQGDDEVIEQLTNVRAVSFDPVRDWLKQAGKRPLLDARQEVEISRQAEVGALAEERLRLHEAELSSSEKRELHYLIRQGERAFDTLVESNLRLVISIAKRYVGRGLEFLDLIQEGNVGLIHAAHKFDYAQGYKFSTYGTWWIRQAITRAIDDQSRTIRIPVHTAEKIRRYDRESHVLLTELGREPTVEEVAQALDQDPERMRELLLSARPPISLNMPMGSDGDVEFGELISDDSSLDPSLSVDTLYLKRDVKRIIDSLPEREATIMRMRYGLDGAAPETLDAVGTSLGITRERVRQIENKVHHRLRNELRSSHLHDYIKEDVV